MTGLLNDMHTDGHAPAVSELFRLTVPGQAHLAEPAIGKSCRECQLWGMGVGKYPRNNWGDLKPAKCRKAVSLMMARTRDVEAVPYTAIACRYFEPNPSPPAADRNSNGIY